MNGKPRRNMSAKAVAILTALVFTASNFGFFTDSYSRAETKPTLPRLTKDVLGELALPLPIPPQARLQMPLANPLSQPTSMTASPLILMFL